MGLRHVLKVYRTGSKSFVDGEWVGEDDSEFFIRASVQPLSPGDAAEAASILQGKQGYRLYTSTRLRSVERNDTCDHIMLHGVKLEVMAVEDWQNGILPHYKILVRALTPLNYGASR